MKYSNQKSVLPLTGNMSSIMAEELYVFLSSSNLFLDLDRFYDFSCFCEDPAIEIYCISLSGLLNSPTAVF